MTAKHHPDPRSRGGVRLRGGKFSLGPECIVHVACVRVLCLLTTLIGKPTALVPSTPSLPAARSVRAANERGHPWLHCDSPGRGRTFGYEAPGEPHLGQYPHMCSPRWGYSPPQGGGAAPSSTCPVSTGTVLTQAKRLQEVLHGRRLLVIRHRPPSSAAAARRLVGIP